MTSNAGNFPFYVPNKLHKFKQVVRTPQKLAQLNKEKPIYNSQTVHFFPVFLPVDFRTFTNNVGDIYKKKVK